MTDHNGKKLKPNNKHRHKVNWIMEKVRPVILFLEPTDENVPRELRPERRRGLEDRRKLHTYIFDDRRSGKADRRKRKF